MVFYLADQYGLVSLNYYWIWIVRLFFVLFRKHLNEVLMYYIQKYAFLAQHRNWAVKAMGDVEKRKDDNRHSLIANGETLLTNATFPREHMSSCRHTAAADHARLCFECKTWSNSVCDPSYHHSHWQPHSMGFQQIPPHTALDRTPHM